MGRVPARIKIALLRGDIRDPDGHLFDAMSDDGDLSRLAIESRVMIDRVGNETVKEIWLRDFRASKRGKFRWSPRKPHVTKGSITEIEQVNLWSSKILDKVTFSSLILLREEVKPIK